MRDNNSNAFNKIYKYPDDQLDDDDKELVIENVNEDVPETKLQKVHFNGNYNKNKTEDKIDNTANDNLSLG